jgi:hypothetical protein
MPMGLNRINITIPMAATYDTSEPEPKQYRFGHVKDSEHPWSLHALRSLPHGARHINATYIRGPLPSTVDLRPGMPPVFNQGNLNSCSANALTAVVMYNLSTQNAPMRSRRFLYWNSLDKMDCTTQDVGASMADGILSLVQNGICSEQQWPYDDTGNRFSIRPTDECFQEAADCPESDPDGTHPASTVSL